MTPHAARLGLVSDRLPATTLPVFLRRAVLAYAGFGASLLYCVGRVLHGVLVSRRDGAGTDISRDTARVMARLTCAGADIRVRVIDEHYVTAAQPCVYVVNHQSFIDYPILATIFPARTVIVGKSEIGRLPLIGWLFRATGHVLLARRDRRSASNTLRQLVHAIAHDGRSIWMFPEGTRRRTVDAMLPFKSGAFRIAAAAGVPIVPIVVSSLAPDIDLGQRRAEPTTITVRVLAPRHIIGDEGMIRALIDETRTEMVRVFVDHRALTGTHALTARLSS